MIATSTLPPCCKDLVSTFVHLAPPWFYEGVQ